MSGNFVTQKPGTNSRGRPKAHTDRAAKQKAYRDRKRAKAGKIPRDHHTGTQDIEFTILAIFMGTSHGIVEVHHAQFGYGVLDLWGMDSGRWNWRYWRVFFRKSPRTLPWQECEVVAWHEAVPKHLKWLHPEHRDARKNRLTQLFDSDRNRDMGGDCAKWDADGGKSADAEVTVQQMFASIDIRDRVQDIDVKPNRKRGRYDNWLAEMMQAAIDSEKRRKCQTGK